MVAIKDLEKESISANCNDVLDLIQEVTAKSKKLLDVTFLLRSNNHVGDWIW